MLIGRITILKQTKKDNNSSTKKIIKAPTPDFSIVKKKKLLCYQLMISKHFPKTHNRAGELTLFEQKIKNQTKKHTIRKNYAYWEKCFKKIDKGEAYLSLREWTGRPRKSKHKILFELFNTDGIGLERLDMIQENYYEVNSTLTTKERIVQNDGLTLEDFDSWFPNPEGDLALIHFTNLRYEILL